MTLSAADLADDLDLAFRLAETAAATALPFYERGVVPELKYDGSPVSEADLAVDRVVLEMLAAALCRRDRLDRGRAWFTNGAVDAELAAFLRG